MSSPQPQRPVRAKRHLYLVPPLSENGSETPPREPATKPAPATFPWDTPTPYGQPYGGRPAYVHTVPTTPPPDDHHDHPPRRRVQWVRPTEPMISNHPNNKEN